MRLVAAVLFLLLTLTMTACQVQPQPRPEPSTTRPSATASATAQPLAGKVVALDPGHNGHNARQLKKINRPVPDGRGGTKACNTTGTATANDYSESAFNFAVATLVKTALEDQGATVVLSRRDDSGVGPCVDERGSFAAKAHADLLVSIHANGSDNTRAHGFHVIVAKPPVNKKLGTASRQAAQTMVQSLQQAGLKHNKAYGKSGISPRSDIAGLNHARVPAVMVECGEMRNPGDAQRMESVTGRQTYAEAIAAGITQALS